MEQKRNSVVFPVFQALDHVCGHLWKYEMIDILIRLGIPGIMHEAGTLKPAA